MVGLTKPIVFILALFAPLLLLWDSIFPRFFRFDPAKLQEISKVSIAKYGDDVEGLMRNLVKDLQKEYPGLVGDFEPSQWVFNVAGGATVSSCRPSKCAVHF